MFFVWYLNLLTSLGLGDVPILIFVKHGSADTLTLVKLNAWNWPHCDLKTSPNTTKPTITTNLTLELCWTTISLLWYHFSCFYHTFLLDGVAKWCSKPADLLSLILFLTVVSVGVLENNWLFRHWNVLFRYSGKILKFINSTTFARSSDRSTLDVQ